MCLKVSHSMSQLKSEISNKPIDIIAPAWGLSYTEQQFELTVILLLINLQYAVK